MDHYICSAIDIHHYYNSNTFTDFYISEIPISTILSPVAVPTSFEGPFGKIVYRVKAVIDTPRFSKDYKAQRPFYLLNLLNLNEVSNIEVRNWRTLVASLTTVTAFSNSLVFFR